MPFLGTYPVSFMVSAQDNAVSASARRADMASDREEDADMIPADAVRAQYPKLADAALEYVKGNRYDYGPRLRGVDMDWEITGGSEAGDGILRIFIEYTPLKSFRGRSGSEYVDLGPHGTVVARRQLRVPKENLPYVLIGLAAASVVALIAVQVLVWFEPFEGGPELYVSGRTLYLRSELPKVQRHIEYDAPISTGEVVRWAISPTGDGTDLVVVEVTLINATSGAVQMVVDRDAAELRIADSVGVKPVNLLERSYSVEVDPSSRWYIPDFRAMWGSYTLNRNEQLSGHMVFEAPTGSEFSEFRWAAGDSPRVSYQ